jgi:hypothetical protein
VGANDLGRKEQGQLNHSCWLLNSSFKQWDVLLLPLKALVLLGPSTARRWRLQ